MVLHLRYLELNIFEIDNSNFFINYYLIKFFKNFHIAKQLNKKEGTMEKNINNQISWLGLMLTKKRAFYLTVLSSIGSSFFSTSVIFTMLVLQFIMTNISPNDNIEDIFEDYYLKT